MAVSPHLKYGLHNAIKSFAIIAMAATSLPLTLANACPDKCLCYGASVDCSGKDLKILSDTLPQQTKILMLDNNNLEEIPNLSYLKLLEKLVISHNNIKNINRTHTSRLTRLKELDLSHNNIKSLAYKTFERGNKLQKLDLSYNNLIDITGLSSSLSNLQELNLQHNKIKSIDVIRRNRMPKLNILRAGHNEIRELVSLLDKTSAFPNLHTLDFSNNKIQRIHMFLTRFKYIRKLVLSHNKLKSINASSFIRNNAMEELYLDHNELSSVTKLWLTFKPRLTYLDLSYNRIHSIDGGTFQTAKYIKYLDISNNNLGSLEAKIFFHLQNLSYLKLPNNNIVYVAEDAFYNLNMLLSLNMSHNLMNLGDKEFDSVFKPLKSLKILDLSNNNILLIPSHAFAGLSKLKTLYMKNNKITVIEDDAFTELKTIAQLLFDTENLVCDCSLKYLRNYIKKKSYESKIRSVCATPLWLKGRNVTDVLDSEVVCVDSNKPTVRPIIVENPKSEFVHLHRNTSLFCATTSSDDSEIEINWYQKFESKIIKHKPTYISKQELMTSRQYKRSSMLNLANVDFEDGGQYWCHVSNMYGSDWSAASNLTVVVQPSLSRDLKKQIVARSGESILIPCSAEGVPPPTVKFTKKGFKDLPFPAVSEKRIVYSNNKFKIGIQNLKIEDSGLYYCIARSRIGKANATIRLIVTEKPKFVRRMRNKSFKNGSTAVIDCIISGNPIPKISWWKDGKQLKSTSSKIKLSNQLLVIMSFDINDQGLYTCEASNRLGTVRTTARLTVSLREASSSKMASDVFISIIIVVVVVVVILTSLAWVILICFCRKRRNGPEEKRDNFMNNYQGEALLSELPKDYVLRCNGKLVTVHQSDKLCDESTGTLLSEKQSRPQEHREHFYGIPTLGNRKQVENQDDSGISLVYSKGPNDESSEISSLKDRPQISYQITTKNNDNVNKETIPVFPREKEWRKSKPAVSTYHPPQRQGVPFTDSNIYSDDKYLASQKKISESNRLKHAEFDPARLKLHNSTVTAVKANHAQQTRFTNFSSDSVQDTDDHYHSYVTSSSGIESGGSSENVSLNSEELMSSNGVVAV